MNVWINDMNPILVFGVDSRKVLGQKLKEYGATRVMLLADEVMDKLGFTAELVKIIKAACLDVVTYEMELGEPTAAKVDRAYAFAMQHKADGLVALGGGAAVDTTKFVGKMLANGGKADDYLGYTVTAGSKVFRPVIAMPTTAGTGAKINTAIACESSAGQKRAASHPATLAIVDPIYTYGLPKGFTASTGIDALCHTVECLYNTFATRHIMADTLSMEAIRLIFKWLPAAYSDGGNAKAREFMSYAATLGGYCLKLRKLTFGHSIANQFSNRYHWAHGVGVSIGLSAVVRYSVAGNPGLIPLLAECVGVSCPHNADISDVGAKVIRAFDDFQKGLGMKTMRELGVPLSFADEMVEEIKLDDKWKVVPNAPDFELLRKTLHELYHAWYRCPGDKLNMTVWSF